MPGNCTLNHSAGYNTGPVASARGKNPSVVRTKLSARTLQLSVATPATTPTPYLGFGEALRLWLARADQNQEGLARSLQVNPSTVTSWMHGRKRPDSRSLARLLAVLHAWLRPAWDVAEVLDALAWLGWDWHAMKRFFRRCIPKAGP